VKATGESGKAPDIESGLQQDAKPCEATQVRARRGPAASDDAKRSRSRNHDRRATVRRGGGGIARRKAWRRPFNKAAARLPGPGPKRPTAIRVSVAASGAADREVRDLRTTAAPDPLRPASASHDRPPAGERMERDAAPPRTSRQRPGRGARS
jgi:hypothetical protein